MFLFTTFTSFMRYTSHPVTESQVPDQQQTLPAVNITAAYLDSVNKNMETYLAQDILLSS